MAGRKYFHSTFRVKGDNPAEGQEAEWEDGYGAELLEEMQPFIVRASRGEGGEVEVTLRTCEQADGAFRLLCQHYTSVSTRQIHMHDEPDWWPKSAYNIDEDEFGPAILNATPCGALCEIAYGASIVARHEALEAIRKAQMRKPQRRASLTGQIMPRLRSRILERDNFRCKRCGNDATNTALEVDHIIPRAKGGTNDERNLQTLCWACNRGKGASDPLPHELEAAS